MKLLRSNSQQAGAALITAMLLAALISLLSAAWLARFDTQLRTVQALRDGTQARWLQRAAIDWARMILQEDPPLVDHLREVWAVPIAAIRMTDLAGSQAATFSGQLADAQGLFNLHNLRGDPSPKVREWASNLAQKAGLSSPRTQLWLDTLKNAPSDTVLLSDVLPKDLNQTQMERMGEVFIWLPTPTPVNINTASHTVLAAHPALGDSGAKAALRYRELAHFANVGNIATTLGVHPQDIAGAFSVNTTFFLATGRMTVGSMDIMARSLLRRSEGNSQLLWTLAL